MANKDRLKAEIAELTPKQVAYALDYLIPARKPSLIVGPPGIAKTAVCRQTAKKLGYKIIIDHPVYSDQTDARGLGFYDAKKNEARFMPAAENLKAVLNATEPTVWCIDDMGQATNAVQASYMPPLLDREIDGKPLPDCVSVVATTNDRTHKSGVTGLLEAVKSRFVTIMHMRPDLDSVCDWMAANGTPAAIPMFLRFKQNLLHDFDPTTDMSNSPCPRTWEHAGDILSLGLEDAQVETALLQGAVGAAAALELQAFLQVYRKLPDIDEMIKHPKQAMIPDQGESALMYAICGSLAMRASRKNFDNIAEYMQRLVEAEMAEYATLILNDAYRRDKSIVDCRGFLRHSTGRLGQYFRGELK